MSVDVEQVKTGGPSGQPLRSATERSPLRELLALAGPTVLQMMSYTLMQFIDTWLLSRLGHVEAAAVGMSGLFAFSVMCFGMGVVQLVNTLVSQDYGRGNYAESGKYLWQGVWFAVAFSILLVPLAPLAERMFLVMGHERGLAEMEAVYLRITLMTTVVKIAATTFGQFLLAINRPTVVFASAVCGVAANAVVAYAMVLGRLGSPKLGVVGAAWAQNIGVTVEALVLVVFTLRPEIVRKFNSLDWKFRWDATKTLLRVGWPSGAQFIADVLAWSMFSSVVLASAGEPAMAANTFAFRFMAVSFMPALGIGTAVTALVGRYIGAGRPDIAIKRANLGFAVNAVYMIACGTGLFLFRNQLMQLFTDDSEVLRIGAVLLTFAAIYQLADALYVSYNGALRGAGDTFVPAIVTAILNWGITVGLGFWVARRWPEYGANGPWAIATAYGMILGIFIYTRFRRGKWKQIRLTGASDGVNVTSESNTVAMSAAS